jgi:hypothetical protein
LLLVPEAQNAVNSMHAVASSEKPSNPQREEQLSKIVRSKTLQHANALQRLLQYLGSKAIEDPLAEIKEYTIGMDVFERGRDYDPKIDTIVRVQIHRLRSKLREYYEAEGPNDEIFVELPKGHYLPTFETRSPAIARANSMEPVDAARSRAIVATDISIREPTSANLDRKSWRDNPQETWRRKAILASVGILLFAGGLLFGMHWSKIQLLTTSYGPPDPAGTHASSTEDRAQLFWANFLGSDKAPVVGFADAVFLADRSSDLFRYRRGASDNRGTPVEPHLAKQFAANPALVEKAGPLYYEDGYTGTGDVQSVFALTRLFTQMGLQMTVKRCRLITIDDLREHNVILLGSPDQNDAVAQLPQNADFVFEKGNPPGAWGARFVNRHPQAGESAFVKAERDPTTQELVTDFGLITIEPSAVPGRYIAILAALDTSGVAGNAEFMSSPTEMAELIERLESMGQKIGNGSLPTFQALLRIDVERGNDVLDVKLLAVHLIRPSGEVASGPSTSLPVQTTR